MQQIFISHSTKDREVATEIRARLIEKDFEVFLDDFDIDFGQNITDRLVEGMANCRYVVVVISEWSFVSHWVPMEVGLALGTGKFLIPYLKTEPSRIPMYLIGRKWVQDTDSLVEFLNRQRVPIEGLRILKALVGETQGRGLNVYKAGFYAPYLCELEHFEFFITKKEDSYYLTENGRIFIYKHLSENLSLVVKPKELAISEEIKERRILLETFAESCGRGLYRYRKSNYYAPMLRELVEKGYLRFDNDKYWLSGAGKKRLKYFLTSVE